MIYYFVATYSDFSTKGIRVFGVRTLEEAFRRALVRAFANLEGQTLLKLEYISHTEVVL